MRLTIYYDGHFWVGVFEETDQTWLRACRYVFGSEPQDHEILELVNRKMLKLVAGVSKAIQTEKVILRKMNPKRLARLAVAETNQLGISTKAQQALKLEQEQRKAHRMMFSKQQKDAYKARKWEIKRERAKEKHRGR